MYNAIRREFLVERRNISYKLCHDQGQYLSYLLLLLGSSSIEKKVYTLGFRGGIYIVALQRSCRW